MTRRPFSYRDDPSVPPFADDRAVVIFDGACALCSRSARTILKRDRRRRFRLLPAQTALGRALYAHYGYPPDKLETMLLLREGRVFDRSDAAIRIGEGLGGMASLASVFRLIPRGWRDAAYDWVARNRIRLFGAADACALGPSVDPDRILG